ncbi:MAG TPA: PilZ domain-containing protein [Planctomycetota bacterium]|nr:PilZ domain-containing protein [Planctomycetota bacterium]
MITQVEIARNLKLDVSTVNKILNRKPGTKFRPDTVEKVYRLARKNGFDFGRLKHHHRREHDRRPVDMESKVAIRFNDGGVFDRGLGRIRDLSIGGARIGDFDLKKAALPTRPFSFELDFDDVHLEAVPVRFVANGTLDIAVAFTNLDGGQRRKLKKLL